MRRGTRRPLTPMVGPVRPQPRRRRRRSSERSIVRAGPADATIKPEDAGKGTDKLYVGASSDKGSQIRPGLLGEIFNAGMAFAKWCNAQGGIAEELPDRGRRPRREVVRSHPGHGDGVYGHVRHGRRRERARWTAVLGQARIRLPRLQVDRHSGVREPAGRPTPMGMWRRSRTEHPLVR